MNIPTTSLSHTHTLETLLILSESLCFSSYFSRTNHYQAHCLSVQKTFRTRYSRRAVFELRQGFSHPCGYAKSRVTRHEQIELFWEICLWSQSGTAFLTIVSFRPVIPVSNNNNNNTVITWIPFLRRMHNNKMIKSDSHQIVRLWHYLSIGVLLTFFFNQSALESLSVDTKFKR